MFESKNTAEYNKLIKSADVLINSHVQLISIVENIETKV